MQSSGTCFGNGRTNSFAGVSSVPTAMAAALAEPLKAAPDCIAGTKASSCILGVRPQSAICHSPVPAAYHPYADGPQH